MNDPNPIDVALIEDNEGYRQALEVMLGVTPDVRVVASVADGESALQICPGVDPDVIVVDYRLPGLDGVETTSAIREACPRASVVVLTASVESGELAALYDAGAVACLTKDRGLEDIVSAIRQAAGRDASLH